MNRSLRLLKPSQIFGDIHEIDFSSLKQKGITALILDIDDTLIPRTENEVTPDVFEWVAERKAEGFKLFFASNSRHPQRVQYIGQVLEVPAASLSFKPLPFGFWRALKVLGVKPNEAAMIGDSLKSDIKPSHAAGMKSILIPRKNWKLNEHDGHEAAVVKAEVCPTLEHAARQLVLGKLEAVLDKVWSAETSTDGDKWSKDNPAWGQCAVTACLVNDILGGHVVNTIAVSADGSEDWSHYYNVMDDGTGIDLTRKQFAKGTQVPQGKPKRKNFKSTKDYVLSYPATLDRYRKLVSAVKTEMRSGKAPDVSRKRQRKHRMRGPNP